jgi:hypothetical protein
MMKQKVMNSVPRDYQHKSHEYATIKVMIRDCLMYLIRIQELAEELNLNHEAIMFMFKTRDIIANKKGTT